MSYTTGKAKRLAKTLNSQYSILKKWRDVAEKHPGINFATLNRIAKTGGAWLPKEKHILELLGIYEPDRCKTCHRRLPAPRITPAPLPDYMAWWRKQSKAKRDEIIRSAHRMSETW